MEWGNIIQILITALVTGGGITTIFTLRQTRQSKDLDNASKLIKEYQILLEKYRAEADEATQRVAALTDEVNEVKRQLGIVQTQLSTSNLAYLNANAFRCNNLACKQRTPPLDEDYLSKMMGLNVSHYERVD